MNSIKKNYMFNMLYQILIIVLPIITTPYISRVLGVIGIGTFGYVVSITSYFILFGSLGIALYGQREIAYCQDDKEKRSKIFYELIILRAMVMLFSIMVFYLIFAVNNQYSIYYRVLVLDLFANCIDISWFFQGMEEFKKITVRNLIIRLTGVIFIFILVKNPDDLIMYILIYAMSNFISNCVLWLNLKKYLCKQKLKDIKPFTHFKSVILFFIPQIAIQLYTVLDKIMIGYILDDMAEVGYYELSQKIIKMLMTLLTSMAAVMLPRIANLYSKKETTQIETYMYKTFNFIFFLSIPMIFGICSVSNNFVPIFFGQGYDKVSIIMCILSFVLLFIGLSAVIGNQYLITTKKQKEYTISVILGACVNFVLNYILIKRFMSIGAAVASVIAELVVVGIQMFYIRKNLKLKKILNISKNYVISGVIMFFVCLPLNFIVDYNFLCLFLKIIIGVIVYVAMLMLLKDDYFQELFNNSKSLIKKFKNKLYHLL